MFSHPAGALADHGHGKLQPPAESLSEWLKMAFTAIAHKKTSSKPLEVQTIDKVSVSGLFLERVKNQKEKAG